MHWAAKYIGLPWRLGASGPDAFDCWGLVRHVQKEHFGIEMPHLNVYQCDNKEEINALLRSSPWKRSSDETKEGDVVLMYGADGPHVGIVLEIDGIAGCLHAIGSVKSNGSVVFTQRLEDLSALGFARLQFWRRNT